MKLEILWDTILDNLICLKILFILILKNNLKITFPKNPLFPISQNSDHIKIPKPFNECMRWQHKGMHYMRMLHMEKQRHKVMKRHKEKQQHMKTSKSMERCKPSRQGEWLSKWQPKVLVQQQQGRRKPRQR